jgi:fused signal recognition particle receptor
MLEVIMGFFKTLFSRKKNNQYQTTLDRASVVLSSLKEAFDRDQNLSKEVLEILEETLLTSDIGFDLSQTLIQSLLKAHQKSPIQSYEAFLDSFYDLLLVTIQDNPPFQISSETHIILMVGVNGVGKTTTIGKLAHKFKEQGKKVMIIAADTFRSAAVEQLEVWARRSQALFYSQASQDPSSVIFDGLKEAKKKEVDVVLIDTAGRLQTKVNLMQELSKMKRVIDKATQYGQLDTLLVLDATTGQNGLSQIKQFHEATELTGMIVTKLDGTAKGGIALGIKYQFKQPIYFVGLGEGINDLVNFDLKDYIMSLFETGYDQ